MADDVTLPGTGQLVETQQQADGSHRQIVSLGDLKQSMEVALENMSALPMAVEPTTGRLRVVLDANGGAQTLGKVTTVASVTNMDQIGGVQANGMIFDAMMSCWANSLRGRIT